MTYTIDTPEGRVRFQELHKQYRNTMLNVALRVLDDPHLAEDAVQESFLRVAGNLSKIGPVNAPPTRVFVITVTKNVALNMKARLSRQIATENVNSLLAAEASLEDSVMERMDYETVLDAIHGLPPIYRECMLLYFVDELNTPEIAERLGIGVETVKKRLQRGKRMVTEGLSEDGFERGGRAICPM